MRWSGPPEAAALNPAQRLVGDGYRVSVRIVTLSEVEAVQVPVSAVFPLPAGIAAAGAAGTGSAADVAGPGRRLPRRAECGVGLFQVVHGDASLCRSGFDLALNAQR